MVKTIELEYVCVSISYKTVLRKQTLCPFTHFFLTNH